MFWDMKIKNICTKPEGCLKGKICKTRPNPRVRGVEYENTEKVLTHEEKFFGGMFNDFIVKARWVLIAVILGWSAISIYFAS
jgi:hypothetical protein